MFGSIFIDNEEANKSISKTEEKAEGLGSKLGNGIKTAAKWSAALVAGAGAAGTAAFAMANKTTAGFDKISKNSAKLGITTDTYQEMSYWASQNGISTENMEKAVGRLNQRIGLALNGNKKYAEGLEKMGVSMDDVRAGTVSTEEAMYTMIQSLSQMDNEQEKAAVASEVFGVKLARELMPALQDGSMTIDEAREAAERLGLVIGEETIDAGVKFQDNLTDIKASLSAVGAQVMGNFIPIFNDMMDWFLDNMPMIQEVMGNVMNSLGDTVSAVMPILMDMIQNALPPLIELFTEIATNILPVLIELFGSIVADVLPVFISLFTDIIKEIAPVFMQLLEVIVKDVLPPLLDLFSILIGDILPPLISFFGEIISTLLPPLIELFSEIMDAIMPVLIELFNTFVEVVLPPLMELIDEIVQVILPPLLAIFNELAEIVLPLVMTVFEALLPVIEPIMNAIADVIGIVLALIKGDWEEVWNGIESFFTNIWDTICKAAEGFGEIFGEIFEGIKKVITGIWDGIVDGIKEAINFIIKGINTFIRGLNKIKIPDWVPGVGGKGLNIKEIPLLAHGGEITQKGHAIVGEAGPELLELPQGARVTPLDNNNSNNKEVATEVNNNFNIANLTVREEADIKKIARELKKLQDTKRGGVAFA